MQKEFYKSKGKVGAIIVAVGGVLIAVGGYLNGTMDLNTAISAIITIGTGLGIYGVRDAQK